MNHRSSIQSRVRRILLIVAAVGLLILSTNSTYASTTEPAATDRAAVQTPDLSFPGQREAWESMMANECRAQQLYHPPSSKLPTFTVASKVIGNEETGLVANTKNEATGNDEDMEAEYGNGNEISPTVEATSTATITAASAEADASNRDNFSTSDDDTGRPSGMPTNVPSLFWTLTGDDLCIARKAGNGRFQEKDRAALVTVRANQCGRTNGSFQMKETCNGSDKRLLYRNGPSPRSPSSSV